MHSSPLQLHMIYMTTTGRVPHLTPNTFLTMGYAATDATTILLSESDTSVLNARVSAYLVALKHLTYYTVQIPFLRTDFDLCTQCISSPLRRLQHDATHAFFPIDVPEDKSYFSLAQAQRRVAPPKAPGYEAALFAKPINLANWCACEVVFAFIAQPCRRRLRACRDSAKGH